MVHGVVRAPDQLGQHAVLRQVLARHLGAGERLPGQPAAHRLGRADPAGQPHPGEQGAQVVPVRVAEVAGVVDRWLVRVGRADPDRPAAARLRHVRRDRRAVLRRRVAERLGVHGVLAQRHVQLDVGVRQRRVAPGQHGDVPLGGVPRRQRPGGLPDHQRLRVVLQVAADPGQVVHDVHPDRPQLGRRADPAEQQQPRGVDRAGAEHHLLPGPQDLPHPVVPDQLDAERAAAVHQHPEHPAAQPQVQVRRPVQQRVHVVGGRRRPQVRLRVVADLEVPGALGPRVGVPALQHRDAERRRGRLHDVGQVGVPVGRRDRLDPGAQPVVQRAERLRAPAGRAELLPLGQVPGRRAEGDHRVVRAAAAEDPGPGLPDGGVAVRLRHAAVVEVVLALHHLRPAPDVAGPRLVPVARPPLQQRDPAAGLRQPAGDHAAGGPAADHDDVVLAVGELLGIHRVIVEPRPRVPQGRRVRAGAGPRSGGRTCPGRPARSASRSRSAGRMPPRCSPRPPSRASGRTSRRRPPAR